jgi:hypothetical protein
MAHTPYMTFEYPSNISRPSEARVYDVVTFVA